MKSKYERENECKKKQRVRERWEVNKKQKQDKELERTLRT